MTLKGDITGTQRRGFKIFKLLQLQERDKLKIDPIKKKQNVVNVYNKNKYTKREERIPTRCNNIDDLLSIVDVDY